MGQCVFRQKFSTDNATKFTRRAGTKKLLCPEMPSKPMTPIITNCDNLVHVLCAHRALKMDMSALSEKKYGPVCYVIEMRSPGFEASANGRTGRPRKALAFTGTRISSATPKRMSVLSSS
eukprot:scaffold441369_cov14-Prasinocladus_malaysianus.AAC.1